MTMLKELVSMDLVEPSYVHICERIPHHYQIQIKFDYNKIEIEEHAKKQKRSYFLAILFLINTIDSSIITAKSGRIIQIENSETVGVGEGVVFGEELAVEAGVGEGTEVVADVGFGVEVGAAAALKFNPTNQKDENLCWRLGVVNHS